MAQKSWNIFNEIFEGFKKFPLFKLAYRLSWAPKTYHYTLALLGAIIYLFPSRKLKVIGVTGTKGKTTTIELISSILEAAGYKTAVLSSVNLKIGSKIKKNTFGNSLPGRFYTQYFLSQAVKAGCNYAIIEVTSQGIPLSRHRFIFWDRAVFLNIHPEHIEAHGSFENYLKAKLSFFEYVARHPGAKNPEFFIQSQDGHAEDFIRAAGNFSVVRFSPQTLDALKIKLPSSLSADFLKINIAAAVAVTRSFNISEGAIKKGVENFKGVEGRMEVVVQKPFRAVVDYAHTPDSLEAVYKYLKKGSREKMICVLGSTGGGRDKWKRPILGKVAAQYCDKIILTDEDPYDENSFSILEDIEKGFSQVPGSKFQVSSKNYWKILDRREAIKKAVSLAKAGDTVICTGKGSEEWIHLAKGQKLPWSEKGIIKSLLP
jgi:UDP-N-acetylmuramyl-tripeptide synthetase